MRKFSWILKLIILSIFSGIFSCVSGLQGMRFSENNYKDYTTSFFIQTTNISVIEPFFAFFAILPILGFAVFNGTMIYENWNIDGIYIITRQKNRIFSFLKSSIRLFLNSFIGSIIYIFVPISYSIIVMNGKPFNNSSVINFKIFITVAVLCYFFAMSINIFSIMFGSNYGFLIGIILFLFSGSLAQNLLDKSSFVIRLAITLLNPFVPFYLSTMDRLSISLMMFYALIQCTIVTIFGLFLIKRIDIGLSNKEMI